MSDMTDINNTVASQVPGLRLGTITMKNFLSVGAIEQRIDLDREGITIIIGENRDQAQADASARNGVGKAQPLYSKILTPDGWKTMGDMNVGDEIVTPDGNITTVDGVYPQGKKDIYEIEFVDGRKTHCCDEHLWKVWARYKETDWGWHVLSTKDLIEHMSDGKKSRYTYVPLIQAQDKPDRMLPIPSKIMGYLLGDGYLKEGSISSKDDEILATIREWLPEMYHLKHVDGYDYRIVLKDVNADNGEYSLGQHKTTHILRKEMCEMGLLECKSDTKFIPNMYKDGSIQQRLDLLQGLMDTDGYVNKNGAMSYTTVSRQLANDVVDVVRSLGGTAAITEKKTRYTHNGDYKDGKLAYVVRIRYKNPRDIVSLNRKKERLSENYQYSDTLRLRIASIKKIGTDYAQCIKVKHEDSLYITDDYIVTHNTTLMNALSYVIYKEAISPIKRVGNFINNVNKNKMIVTVDFTRNGRHYRVERGQKPNLFRFYVDGVEQKEDSDQTDGEQRGDSRDTEREVIDAFGMEFSMFQNIFCMHTYMQPFLTQKPAEQKTVIEELFGVTILSTKAGFLNTAIRNTKNSIQIKEGEIETTKATNARIQQQIDALAIKSVHFEDTRLKTIGEIEANMTTLNGIDFDAELAKFDAIDEYNSKVADFRSAKNQINAEVKLLEQEAGRILGVISELESSKSSENTQAVRLASDLERYQSELDSHEETVAARVSDVKTRYNKDVERIVRESEQRVSDLKATMDRKVANAEARIADLNADLAQVEAERSDPNTHTCPTCSQGLDADSDHLKGIMERLNGRIAKINGEIEEENQIINDARQKFETESAAASDYSLAIESLGETAALDQKNIEDGAASTKQTLMENVSAVSTQIVEVTAAFETQQADIAHKISESNREATTIATILSEKMAEEAEKDREISALGDVPVPFFPTRDATYQAKSLYDQLTRDLVTEKSKENPYTEQIEVSKATLRPIAYDDLNLLVSDLEHQELLKKLLTDKKSFLRKRIIDQSLAYMNTRLRFYLDRFGLQKRIEFMNDLSVNITEMNGAELDVGNLSRGETSRVSNALSFTFRDLWENINGPCNLFFIDEVLDNGLDGQGVNMAFDIIKEMTYSRKKTVFLITHREELLTRANNVIKVVKEGGFSTYEDNYVSAA